MPVVSCATAVLEFLNVGISKSLPVAISTTINYKEKAVPALTSFSPLFTKI